MTKSRVILFFTLEKAKTIADNKKKKKQKKTTKEDSTKPQHIY